VEKLGETCAKFGMDCSSASTCKNMCNGLVREMAAETSGFQQIIELVSLDICVPLIVEGFTEMEMCKSCLGEES